MTQFKALTANTVFYVLSTPNVCRSFKCCTNEHEFVLIRRRMSDVIVLVTLMLG